MSRKQQTTSTVAAAAIALASLPRALATPAARWGHQAVYVKSKQAMYVVGGDVSTSDTEITNEVLMLQLNSSSPSFSTGSSDGLPPHAFAAMTLSDDQSSLVVMGGMTSDCDSDGLAHTLDLTSDDGWASTSPSKFTRRRAAGIVWVDNNSTNGEVMVVGGISDSYSCGSSTAAYTASDILSLPLSSTALVSSRSLPTSLTGSDLAVSDFGLTRDSSGKNYLIGGQTSSGDLVSLDTIGVWDSTNGWQSQTTSGDVPDGRIGASLVAHPTLDVVVMYGGSVSNSTSGSYSASSLLSLLNTTTFEWSSPSSLQPSSSSAAAYHSAVMTDQGVMITAFGLSSSDSPSSSVTYLDLRDTTQSSWAWTSSWSSDMLSAYSDSSSTTSSTISGTSGVSTASDSTTTSGNSSKKLASIIAPVVVVALLISPLIIYFVRRRASLIKKRRMAQHFSFSSQEDSGAFSFRTPFDHYLAKRQSTQNPFAQVEDANEREGSLVSTVTSSLRRMASRISNSSSNNSIEEQGERQMAQVGQRVHLNMNNEQPMNWEEIDFGLGKLDESKNHDTSYIANSGALVQVGQDLPVAPASSAVQSQGYSPDMIYAADQPMAPAVHVYQGPDEAVSPFGDDQAIPTPPPAVTCISGRHNNLSTFPVMEPSPAYTPNGDGGDWSRLQQSLNKKPAFRAISPTAQLRSHAHPSQTSPSTSEPAPAITSALNRTSSLTRTPSNAPSFAPSIPPFEFERAQTPNGTITLVDPQQSAPQAQEILPFAGVKGVAGPNRSVSQPISRQIAGKLARRVSVPSSSSGESGEPAIKVPSRSASVNHATPVRRESASTIGSVKYPSVSQKTTLRVVNMTEGEEED